jgi:hypothetical protein
MAAPRFLNGGLLFSAITLVFIAIISLYSFLLLVETKFIVSGSFGGQWAFVLTVLTVFIKLLQISEAHFTGRGCATRF